MADHFACVGLDVPERDAFAHLVDDLSRAASRSTGPAGIRALWSDPSGAALALFSPPDGKGITCAKPSFVGRSRLVVWPTTMVEDPRGCPFCAVAMVEVREGDQLLYPLAIELDDVQLGPLDTSGPVTVGITAFGESVEVWAGASEYQAGEHLYATQSLIPSGTFSPGGTDWPLRAEAILTGVVTRAERLTNGRTGAQFDQCQVETLGATVDVVLAPMEEPLRPGQVIQGTFWLVGRRIDDDA